MNNKMTYSIKNDSSSCAHVVDVVKNYGDKATFKVNGVAWKIKGAKPQGRNSTLLFLEL